jgi:hypothetical protein
LIALPGLCTKEKKMEKGKMASGIGANLTTDLMDNCRGCEARGRESKKDWG